MKAEEIRNFEHWGSGTEAIANLLVEAVAQLAELNENLKSITTKHGVNEVRVVGGVDTRLNPY